MHFMYNLCKINAESTLVAAMQLIACPAVMHLTVSFAMRFATAITVADVAIYQVRIRSAKLEVNAIR